MLARWWISVLSGALEPVVSSRVRDTDAKMAHVLQQILTQGQERGEVTRGIPVVRLTQALDGLYKIMISKWAGDIGAA
jgi:hypothetical protein